MSAIPHDFLHATAQLGKTIARPYPNSRKTHIQGSRPDLRAPLREISQDATPTALGAEANPPIPVYDCSKGCRPFAPRGSKSAAIPYYSPAPPPNTVASAPLIRQWRICVLN